MKLLRLLATAITALIAVSPAPTFAGSAPLVDLSHRRDGVGLDRWLVGPVAQHPRESKPPVTSASPDHSATSRGDRRVENTRAGEPHSSPASTGEPLRRRPWLLALALTAFLGWGAALAYIAWQE